MPTEQAARQQEDLNKRIKNVEEKFRALSKVTGKPLFSANAISHYQQTLNDIKGRIPHYNEVGKDADTYAYVNSRLEAIENMVRAIVNHDNEAFKLRKKPASDITPLLPKTTTSSPSGFSRFLSLFCCCVNTTPREIPLIDVNLETPIAATTPKPL